MLCSKFTLAILFLLFAHAPGMPLSAQVMREWTNLKGDVVEAELRAVHEKTVTLVNPEGQSLDYPRWALKEADQKFIEQWQAYTQGHPLAELTWGKLLRPTGRGGSLEPIETPPDKPVDYFGLYFAAAWSEYSRDFTRELIVFYDETQAANRPFEIIFVSSDKSAEAMAEHVEQSGMPWPCLPYKMARRFRKLDGLKKYCVDEIPALEVIDSRGEVIFSTFAGKEYRGPEKVVAALRDLLFPAETEEEEAATPEAESAKPPEEALLRAASADPATEP